MDWATCLDWFYGLSYYGLGYNRLYCGLSCGLVRLCQQLILRTELLMQIDAADQTTTVADWAMIVADCTSDCIWIWILLWIDCTDRATADWDTADCAMDWFSAVDWLYMYRSSYCRLVYRGLYCGLSYWCDLILQMELRLLRIELLDWSTIDRTVDWITAVDWLYWLSYRGLYCVLVHLQ